jgi:hypothetical protein
VARLTRALQAIDALEEGYRTTVYHDRLYASLFRLVSILDTRRYPHNQGTGSAIVPHALRCTFLRRLPHHRSGTCAYHGSTYTSWVPQSFLSCVVPPGTRRARWMQQRQRARKITPVLLIGGLSSCPSAEHRKSNYASYIHR